MSGRRSLGERLAPALFGVSLAVLATAYGVVAAWWGWFPAPQMGLAYNTAVDLRKNWRNDFALEPTRHLVPPSEGARTTGETGFAMHAEAAAEPGYILVSSLSPEQDVSAHAVTLYDGDGAQIHRWPVRYADLEPEGARPLNVLLHGMEVMEDGSVIVTFDAGRSIARLDACGEPMWQQHGAYHHSITRDGTGGIVTWLREEIVRLDAETGEQTASLSLRDDIVPGPDGDQRGLFDIRTITERREKPNLRYLEDPFHPNDAEPLSAAMADAFPMFEVGDLLISLRELNMIAVVDDETGELKWSQHGPWIKQHDPDFQPDGTITVYDNGTGTGASKIRSVDPATGETKTIFADTAETPFYSWRRGKHQILPGGNILVTESERGRLFEVTPEGRVVWERDMIWDDTQNLIATEARWVPADFFVDGPPACGARSS